MKFHGVFFVTQAVLSRVGFLTTLKVFFSRVSVRFDREGTLLFDFVI